MMSLHPAELLAVSRRSELDCLLALACNAFDVPVVLLSLVNNQTLCSKNCSELDCNAIVADTAFCNLALPTGDLLVVDEVADDARIAGKRLAADGPAIRFYAGVPIMLESGRPAGSLCLVDVVPRQLLPEQRHRLREIGKIVGVLLADALRAQLIGNLTDALSERMRRAHDDGASIARYRKMYERASALAHIGVWECDLATEELTWTDGVYDIFELPRGARVSREVVLSLYDRQSRLRMERMRRKAIEDRASCSLDIRIRTAKGNRRWVRLTIDVEAEDGRAVRIFGLKQDITQERDLLDRLRRLAEIDPMTGLANRSMFEGRLARALGATSRATAATALVLIDLDGFKEINDTHGHAAGDECLRQIARRLRTVFKRPHVIGRIGGDEFAVLVQGPRSAAEVERLVVEAIARIRWPIEHAGARLVVGASVGVSYPADIRGYDLNALFAEADQAMYAAKKSGRDGYRVFGREEERPSGLQPPPAVLGVPAA
jgi:diguanylate cyclase (GGDEF)-like protein